MSAEQDHLPENTRYRDSGCDLAPTCLECPLPACRYDLPPKQAGALLREQQLQGLLKKGHSADEAAVLMEVSRRTVFRLKKFPAHTKLGVMPIPIETPIVPVAEPIQERTTFEKLKAQAIACFRDTKRWDALLPIDRALLGPLFVLEAQPDAYLENAEHIIKKRLGARQLTKSVNNLEYVSAQNPNSYGDPEERIYQAYFSLTAPEAAATTIAIAQTEQRYGPGFLQEIGINMNPTNYTPLIPFFESVEPLIMGINRSDLADKLSRSLAQPRTAFLSQLHPAGHQVLSLFAHVPPERNEEVIGTLFF